MMAFAIRLGPAQWQYRLRPLSPTGTIVISILFVLNSRYVNSNEEVVGGSGDWAGTWCPPPFPIIPNSNMSASETPLTVDYSPPGTRLSIACDTGYHIEPIDGSVECYAGRWTSFSAYRSNAMSVDRISSLNMPQCRVGCQRPIVEHGDIKNSDSEFPPGAKVQVHCDDGYRLANKYASSLECGADDGKWTGHNGDFTKESPECVLATCPPLPMTPNAILEYQGTTGWDGGFHEGSKVSYACRQGYRMTFDDDGPADRSFQCHDGDWQNLIHVACELVGCGPPPLIFDGEVVVDRPTGLDMTSQQVDGLFPVGMRVTYRCSDGFVLVGPTKRYRCSAKGHWVPMRLPTCRHLEKDDKSEEQVARHCPAPPTISHARLENATAMMAATGDPCPPNTVVSYICDDGFFLEGLPRLICDWTGQWQPLPGPNCRPKIILPEDCLKPQPEPESKMNDISRNIVAEGRQMVPLLVGTMVSIILLSVLLVVRYLSGWKTAGIPVCRSTRLTNDDVITRRVGTNSDIDPRRRRSASSLLYCEPDRVALLNGTRGTTQILPPTYEEAIQENPGGIGAAGNGNGNGDPLQPLDVMYSCVLLPSIANANRHRCYRFTNLRNGHGASTCNGGDGLNPSFRQSSTSHSGGGGGGGGNGGGRSTSLADSLNSTDTVTPSEVSTTVTVDTLSSTASSHPTSSISTRAFCGSLASFDTAESDSALNLEGVPLLEETEVEQGVSPSAETRTVLET